MVLPLILGGASIASSLAGAASGIMNARTAAKQAAAQNELNLRQFLEQQRLARVQEEMAKATTTDARGNVTQYIPGVGWVTRPSARTDALMRASDNEERLRLTGDAVRSRLRREDAFTDQQRERLAADGIMRNMDEGRTTPADIRGLLIDRNVARATSGLEDARRRLGTLGLRAGTSGQTAFARMARSGIDNTRTALADARAEAPDAFAASYAGRTNPRYNQYNMMQTRATNADADVPFQPTNLDDSLEGLLRNRIAMAPQGVGSAMNTQPYRMNYAEDRTPVALGGLGSFLQGLSERYGSRTQSEKVGSRGVEKADGWTSW